MPARCTQICDMTFTLSLQDSRTSETISMGCLSLKHGTASAPSASLGWVHRLREKGFSTLKTFSLLTVINKGREEPILILQATLLTFCNSRGICTEGKKKTVYKHRKICLDQNIFPSVLSPRLAKSRCQSRAQTQGR